MVVLQVCGGNVASRPAAFSHDNKLAYFCSGPAVRVVAVANGEELYQLVGHTGDITGVQLNPHNPKQVVTASLDGDVRFWDCDEGTCLKTLPTHAPIAFMAVPSAERDMLYLAHLGGKWRHSFITGEEVSATLGRSVGRPTTKLVRFDCARGRVSQTVFKDSGLATGLACRSTAATDIHDFAELGSGGEAGGDEADASGVGSFVAMTFKRRLVLWDSRRRQVTKYGHVRPLTSVCLHPSKNLVVTGDSDGQLVLWHKVLGEDSPAPEGSEELVLSSAEAVVTTSLHWHAHPVTTAAFTVDGSMLLSGGAEAVLVLWQLETGARTFLPRLGAPLRSLTCSPDGQLYSVGLADNSVNMIDAAGLKRQWHMRSVGLGGHSSKHRYLAGGVMLDPRTGSLVLNAAPTHAGLQFYDAVADRHVAELCPIDRSYVSPADSSKKAVPVPYVAHAAFADAGRTLATVDHSPHAAVGGEAREQASGSWSLKFWEHSASAGGFVLTALVDAPHTGAVTALAFSGDGSSCVSASADGSFKIWRKASRAKSGVITAAHARKRASETTWRCHSVGSFRGLPAVAAQFSGDSSLLAVAFGHVVTLWLPGTNELCRTLSHHAPGDDIKHMAMVGSSQFLVTATESELLVWNLVTCSVWWSYAAQVTALAVDTQAPALAARFVVALAVPGAGKGSKGSKGSRGSRGSGNGSVIACFDASSPHPVAVYDIGTDVTSAVVVAPALKVDRKHAEESAGGQGEGEHPHIIYFLTATNSVLAIVPRGVESMLAAKPTVTATAADGTTRAFAASASAPKPVSGEAQRLATFEAVFGTRRKVAGEEAAGEAAAAAASGEAVRSVAGSAHGKARALADVFAGPSHTLPGVGSLFTAFVAALASKGEAGSAAEADVEMGGDSEGESEGGSDGETDDGDGDVEMKNEVAVHMTHSETAQRFGLEPGHFGLQGLQLPQREADDLKDSNDALLGVSLLAGVAGAEEQVAAAQELATLEVAVTQQLVKVAAASV